MPVHDWTRVEAGIFHDFHVAWLPEIRKALNGGLLPEGFYALAEQHAGRTIADVLTLHASPGNLEPLPPLPTTGGTAVAEAPPRVRRRESLELGLRARRRSVAIRHVSGHRLVALLEIVSPANKDRQQSVDDFAAKAVDALDAGIHLVVVDLFPPGPMTRRACPAPFVSAGGVREADPLPAGEPLTLASYVTGPGVDIYLEHLAPGGVLPEMPLFLNFERYVNLPLESTYRPPTRACRRSGGRAGKQTIAGRFVRCANAALPTTLGSRCPLLRLAAASPGLWPPRHGPRRLPPWRPLRAWA